MQIEITLIAPHGCGYSARDLGFLLHKHPDNLHMRDTGAGTASIFYSEVGDQRTTAVLYLELDAVELVRGKNRQAEGLLSHYVNDRPYVANSFLSVALGRSFGQSMSGKSKERQDLADQPLPFDVRVVPVAIAGEEKVVETLFQPLGYSVSVEQIATGGSRKICDLRLSATIRLADLLSHLYVLVPVLDNAKHYWIDRDEVEKLIEKAGPWLSEHPAKELITKRVLKHRRGLVNKALERLAEDRSEEDQALEDSDAGEVTFKKSEPEAELEKTIRLHDLRLDTVLELIKSASARSVLDLGCGEGKLMRCLVRERGIDRIVGVDASVRTLKVASRRLHLDTAGDAMRERVQLQLGSLTYANRRWQGFDAATLVEVIEHIDPPRLSALEQSLFGFARPRMIIVTTPNIEYNAMFEGMPEDSLRHPDHRFEWTRAEFQSWAERVAGIHGYDVSVSPLGQLDETLGAPSQMAVFKIRGAP